VSLHKLISCIFVKTLFVSKVLDDVRVAFSERRPRGIYQVLLRDIDDAGLGLQRAVAGYASPGVPPEVRSCDSSLKEFFSLEELYFRFVTFWKENESVDACGSGNRLATAVPPDGEQLSHAIRKAGHDQAPVVSFVNRIYLAI
jgi:hypothetical protein